MHLILINQTNGNLPFSKVKNSNLNASFTAVKDYSRSLDHKKLTLEVLF